MDGSERLDEGSLQVEEEVVVAAHIEEEVVVNSQPLVVVERIPDAELVPEQPMDTGEEPHIEPLTNTNTSQQNGTPVIAAVTVDDIIADAVSAEDGEEDTLATEPAEASEDKADGEGEGEKETAEEPPKRVKREKLLDQDQCRCCTSKENLQSIFEPLKGDSSLAIHTLIQKICPNVHITKRDHLPPHICSPCVYKLEIAWEFKQSCEKTDRELRKNLTRSQNKTRKRTDYQLLDYATSDDDEQPADDDEFKLSDELSEEEPSDSDISFTDEKPKKRGRPRKSQSATPKPTPPKTPKMIINASGELVKRGRGRPRKDETVVRSTPTSSGAAKAARTPFVYVEAKEESDDSYEDEPLARPKTVTRRVCAKCKETLTGPVHKCKIKTEFACTFCAEKFSSHGLYVNHQQLHSNYSAVSTCIRCHKRFPNKFELRKHQAGVRCVKAMKNNCLSCGRVMANANQLAVHLRTNCTKSPKTPTKVPPKSTIKKEDKVSQKDKNLFKFVAPPTSTYWSDSFSD